MFNFYLAVSLKIQNINVFLNDLDLMCLYGSYPADNFGQRALVGKVCMDCNSMMPHYKELLNECEDETTRLV